MQTNIYLGIAWLIYGAIHSLLATEILKKAFPSKYYRLIYNSLAIVLIIPILYLQVTLPSVNMMQSSLLSQILSGMMMLSGIYLVYVSFRNYDLKAFLGIDFNDAKKKSDLQIEGVSSVVRHPIYTGILLFLWGTFGYFTTESYLVTAIALTLYIRIGIYFEEKKLVQEFGKQYEKYQKEVPMLIPKF
ncbi:methyltransferase family protein [Arcicella aurantiaca]|nr:isoprenylcysteine carboxylmethyltransferase family protein [Arcicella aurantiaca]